MQKVTFGERTFFTTDAIAAELTEAVSLVRRTRRSMDARVTAFTVSGAVSEVQLSLKPDTTFLTRRRRFAFTDPDSSTCIAELRSSALRLGAARPVQSMPLFRLDIDDYC
jgi:hypothetical protein